MEGIKSVNTVILNWLKLIRILSVFLKLSLLQAHLHISTRMDHWKKENTYFPTIREKEEEFSIDRHALLLHSGSLPIIQDHPTTKFPLSFESSMEKVE